MHCAAHDLETVWYILNNIFPLMTADFMPYSPEKRLKQCRPSDEDHLKTRQRSGLVKVKLVRGPCGPWTNKQILDSSSMQA